MEFKVKVRGIYATALTKLLIEKGFKIVDPSPEIAHRLNLDENLDEEPDVKIRSDSYDRHRIYIEGGEKACIAVIQSIREEVPSLAVFKPKFDPYSIYVGRVIANTMEGLIVDIGEAYGVLHDTFKTYHVGDFILVQIQTPTWIGTPKLSDRITLRGTFTAIQPGSGVEFNPKIEGEARSTLLGLASNLGLKGFKIRFQKYKPGQPLTPLIEELKNLVSEYTAIAEETRKTLVPRKVRHGVKAFKIEFSSISKKRLDEIRRSVAATVEEHHSLKSVQELSRIVDFAEYAISKGLATEFVSRLLRSYVDNLIQTGCRIEFEHSTLTGRVVKLRPGSAVFSNGKLLIVKRVFSGSGFYDGLGIPISPGDYGYTVVEAGSWFIRHGYFSPDNSFKGEYVNLNTPPEVLPGRIRYLDLAVDLVRKPDGSIEVLDLDKLEAAFEEDVITESLYEETLDKLSEAEKGLKGEWKTLEEILRDVKLT